MKKENIIYGTNTVASSINAHSVSKIYLVKGYSNKRIIDLIKLNKIFVEYVSKAKLDELTNNGVHQGIVAIRVPYQTIKFDELIDKIKDVKNPLLVMLDELNDPHNLGAILRSCDAFNVDGVIFKTKNQVHLTDVVAKASTGAINYVNTVQVVNLTQTILKLKKLGFWIISLDGEAKASLKDIPKNCPLCVVVGSEGHGISRLVKENSDLLVKIPMQGHVECLNASVACSIALYHIKNSL